MKMDKNTTNLMGSVNCLPGQLSEVVVLLEVWCVGSLTLAVANGRTGWGPDLRVTIRNSNTF